MKQKIIFLVLRNPNNGGVATKRDRGKQTARQTERDKRESERQGQSERSTVFVLYERLSGASSQHEP